MIMALLVLSMIVLFHELGHFLLARANGIAVLEFSLDSDRVCYPGKAKKVERDIRSNASRLADHALC